MQKQPLDASTEHQTNNEKDYSNYIYIVFAIFFQFLIILLGIFLNSDKSGDDMFVGPAYLFVSCFFILISNIFCFAYLLAAHKSKLYIFLTLLLSVGILFGTLVLFF